MAAIILMVVVTAGFGAAKFLDEKLEIVGGTMRPGTATGQTLEGVYNFRTIGIDDKMKTGLLWRSTRLAAATPEDISHLAKLLRGGVVIDLRTAIERRLSPDPEIPNVLNKSFPISGAASAGSYVAAFVKNAGDRATFGRALTAIANAGGKVLIHCTYGKDRTGWLVAMIMYSLGANDNQVMTEYLRSNGQVKGASVNRTWLNAALRAARQKYGSIDGYIRDGLGVSGGTLAKLRAKFAE